MRWQDIVLSIGSLLFTAALIPTLRSDAKPAFLTSIVTAAVLTSFLAVYLSLSLWFATITTAMSTACWWFLAWQTRGSSVTSSNG